jgi:hypothetical protein
MEDFAQSKYRNVLILDILGKNEYLRGEGIGFTRSS